MIKIFKFFEKFIKKNLDKIKTYDQILEGTSNSLLSSFLRVSLSTILKIKRRKKNIS